MNTYVFEHMDAVISPCGRYRYRLERGWPGGTGILVFVLLNPSTADATVPDPTVRRCCAFAAALGYAGIMIVNLFAWRDANPKKLLLARAAGHDIIGPENDAHLREVLRPCAGGTAAVAWGGHAFLKSVLPARARAVLEIMREGGVAPVCFGTTKDGSPLHPLYLPTTSTLRPFELAP